MQLLLHQLPGKSTETSQPAAEQCRSARRAAAWQHFVLHGQFESRQYRCALLISRLYDPPGLSQLAADSGCSSVLPAAGAAPSHQQRSARRRRRRRRRFTCEPDYQRMIDRAKRRFRVGPASRA